MFIIGYLILKEILCLSHVILHQTPVDQVSVLQSDRLLYLQYNLLSLILDAVRKNYDGTSFQVRFLSPNDLHTLRKELSIFKTLAGG